MKQSLTLLIAIILGGLLPQLAFLSPAISYMLGVMLFFSFLKAHITPHIFREKRVYLIFWANIIIGWVAYFLLLPLNEDVAFIAFLVGMTPTALAAPAVISVLKGKIEFVAACVIVTNFGIGLLLPFFSSLISPTEISAIDMLIKILLLLGIPFLAATLVKWFLPDIHQKLLNQSGLIFYLWGSIIVIAMAKSSAFLRANWSEYADLIPLIAISTAMICLSNFIIWYFLWGKKLAQEASQSLWQKNPMLMIWIALQFFSPLIALGPTFYIIFHNLVNAWKMIGVKK